MVIKLPFCQSCKACQCVLYPLSVTITHFGQNLLLQDIATQLKRECADNDCRTRFAQPLRGVKKWLAKHDLPTLDVDNFTHVVSKSWNKNT